MKKKIKFVPQNVEVEVESGKSVLDIALQNGIAIKSSCKGMASCGECRVFVVEGEGHILPPTQQELDIIGQGYFIDQRRLSCQLYCFDNLVVDLKEQVEKSKLSKTFLKRIKKDTQEEIRSVGDNLIEKDLDMKKQK